MYDFLQSRSRSGGVGKKQLSLSVPSGVHFFLQFQDSVTIRIAILAQGFSSDGKICIPTLGAEHKKKFAQRPPECENMFSQHPLDGNAIAKSATFSNRFSMVFKSSKIPMHFLHTSSILRVSLFDFAKLTLAKRYAHCQFVNNDACRLGGVEKV